MIDEHSTETVVYPIDLSTLFPLYVHHEAVSILITAAKYSDVQILNLQPLFHFNTNIVSANP